MRKEMGTILTRSSDDKLGRCLELTVRAIDDEQRTVELAFSSEFPVSRWGDKEILWHDKSAVQLGRLRKAGSLLFAHGRDSNYGVMPVGKITEARLDDDRIARAKVQFNTDERSELVWQNIKNGSLKGVSFGYTVSKWMRLREKETWNGFEGPCYIGTKWEPHEISIEPTPADPTVGIGRSEPPLIEAENPPKEDTERMETTELKAVEIEVEPVGDIVQRALAADRARIAEVRAVCDQSGLDFAANMDKPVEEVRKLALDKLAAETKAVKTAHVEVGADETDKFRSAAVDGMAVRCGVEGVKVESGNPFRGMTMLEMARNILERDGVNHWGMDRMDIAKRAMFGSSDFPYILANVAKKSLMSAYDLAPSTWQAWCRSTETSDFKTMYVNALSEAPDLLTKLPGGAYKMATFSENRESYAIGTFGREFAMTREMVINDDLGAFNRIARAFGQSAKRKINELPYAILVANGNMADGHALFEATYHKNYAAAAGALSVTSLATAFASFRRQTDLSGEQILNIVPKFLIIPPELEVVARQLINSAMDPVLTNSAAVNPFAGRLQIVVDAELTDATDWFLAADPNQIDTIEVCFLSGARGPVLESMEDWPTDAIRYKVRIDVGAKAIDHRGLYLGHNA